MCCRAIQRLCRGRAQDALRARRTPVTSSSKVTGRPCPKPTVRMSSQVEGIRQWDRLGVYPPACDQCVLTAGRGY